MKQKSVAASSTEADYIAMFESVRESIWLKLLMNGIKTKRERYSRVPRLADTRYSASVNINQKFHHFSGISTDIRE